MTVSALERVELIFAGLEGELSDLGTTVRTGPVALHHRARGKTTAVIITTVHIVSLRSYFLLTHDPLERNYTLSR